MLSQDRKALADRILKLLALASSTTFTAEAQSARDAAERLMAAHNISLDPGKPSQDTIEMRQYKPFAKGMRWEGMIANALGELCACKVFFDSRTLDNYELVGTISNLDVLDYMLREVNRQRISAWMNYKAAGVHDSFNKFCYGFAVALENKIDSVTRYGMLTAQERAKLKLWYEEKIGQKTQSFSLGMGSASSGAGLDAGKNASLHRGALGQTYKQLGRPGGK
jgi:hypothetical protein